VQLVCLYTLVYVLISFYSEEGTQFIYMKKRVRKCPYC